MERHRNCMDDCDAIIKGNVKGGGPAGLADFKVDAGGRQAGWQI